MKILFDKITIVKERGVEVLGGVYKGTLSSFQNTLQVHFEPPYIIWVHLIEFWLF